MGYRDVEYQKSIQPFWKFIRRNYLRNLFENVIYCKIRGYFFLERILVEYLKEMKYGNNKT